MTDRKIETDRDRDRQTDRDRDRQQRETDRHRQTDRQTDTQYQAFTKKKRRKGPKSNSKLRLPPLLRGVHAVSSCISRFKPPL